MYRPPPSPSVYPVHDNIFHAYQRPNAELYVKGCMRRYGEMSQQDLIDCICAADQRLRSDPGQTNTDRQLMQRGWTYKSWFLCQEWMDHGFFNENTCVYYQRKFQDNDLIEKKLLDVAADYSGELYGYPGAAIGSADFLIVPKDKDKHTFLDLLDRTNWDVWQWGYLPSLLSDIRIWPLRYKLPIDNTVSWPEKHPWECVPGAW